MKQARIIGVGLGIIMLLGAATPQPCSGDSIPALIEMSKQLDWEKRVQECRELPLGELNKRRGRLLERANKRLEILNKMEAIMRQAAAAGKAPDPNLLRPEALATGYRSSDYHQLPPYLQKLTDEYEGNWDMNLWGVWVQFIGSVIGMVNPNQSTVEGFSWAHYNVQAYRTAHYIALVLRDIKALDECIQGKTTPVAGLAGLSGAWTGTYKRNDTGGTGGVVTMFTERNGQVGGWHFQDSWVMENVTVSGNMVTFSHVYSQDCRAEHKFTILKYETREAQSEYTVTCRGPGGHKGTITYQK